MRERKIRPPPVEAQVAEPSPGEITLLRCWFPALWFIAFWSTAFLLFRFGPIVFEKLGAGTWVYLLASLGSFTFAYWQATSATTTALTRPEDGESPERAWAWVRWLAPASFLGAVGLVLDRTLFAGASLAKTLTDTASVREETVATTILTTVSVVPYSFFVTALALYFHLLAARRRVPGWAHALIWSMMLLLCLNTVLMAKRGGVIWVAVYLLYFLFFVKGEKITTLLLSRRYLIMRTGLLCFLAAVFVYFNFITQHRHDAGFLKRVGADYMERDRYGLFNRSQDPAGLTTLLYLMSYGTHTLPVINAICSQAPWVSWDPMLLLGGRTLDQIRKFYPDYETKSERLVDKWRYERGVSLAAWPTLFGWSAAQFGLLGGVLYLGVLGYFLGWTSRRYLYGGSTGALILNFSLFLVLCNSFNGNGGDIPHNVAFVLGAYMMLSAGRDSALSQPWRQGRRRGRSRQRRAGGALGLASQAESGTPRVSEVEPQQTHGEAFLG